MPVSTIYLLRHGDSRRDGVKRFMGRTDLPLSAAGEAQAKEWQRQLAHLTFSRVICSDLNRSRETAKLVALGHGVALQEISSLREIDMGEWDGRSFAEIRQQFPDAFSRRGEEIATFRPPGGESFSDLEQRVLPAFSRLVQGATGNLLVVGHAGVNRVLICHLLGMPLVNLFRIGQGYGCLNLIEASADGFRVQGVNLPRL
ncbi:alpha-ribazole phosphatase [Geobacter pelophilus]|uniref:Alpha-ribazole phosphatase n=1 Tax=Geoanaerobacter pelophilus TaxID=60036 RepID=A0AAW4L4P0_9BACT|nr:alpha-ribazole phosphatase [Geoanaerobacter pelophilus]MBT0665147.1 alpha-ribazole phosphatase [Geoanaerobacter pelophilus]